MIIYLPVVAAVIGLLVYALATNPKVSEAGRILFAAGCFAALFTLGGR